MSLVTAAEVALPETSASDMSDVTMNHEKGWEGDSGSVNLSGGE